MKEDYTVFWIFAYSSTYSALIPAIVGAISFKQRTLLLKILWLFAVVSFCLDNTALYIPSYANETSNLFRLVEFYVLLIIYYKAFEPRWIKMVFYLLGLLYLALFLSESFLSSKGQLNAYSITLTSLVFIVFSVRFFYVLIRDLPTAQIQRLPMFWVNTAVLTYFAGGLFVFAMRNYLVNTLNDSQTIYWSFHNFLNIGKNLLFAIALWQDLRKPKPI